MDNDKKTTIAGGISGVSLITYGLTLVQTPEQQIAGGILIVAGVALIALGIWTNKPVG